MSTIKESLLSFRESVEPQATLVAVSKTKPISDLQEAYEAGQRHLGENKIQEMTEKWEALPKDIHWHMIGHTQRNKVKYMAPYVHLIHSVDSPRLLKEINKQAKNNDRIINCLLQIHIAQEDSKFGFDEKELIALLKDQAFKDYEHVQIKGLMGMATFTDNKDQVTAEFKSLADLYKKIQKEELLSSRHDFTELSMGMTGDYQIALEEGSTMVRIGSAIFGSRN
ncbi:YggS family pyridoxal phosphate-dependent enzyme [Nonlabens sp. Ci31]|jgi:pyridoxal phosphate enzyme (YggS family)|uniref:YggS family pyridoxal phosphate-dependent enzyme n=1 Tax=Nonlabens sp. Ci31 TaxID=2608253 RepID=UPI001462E8BA|nr:YggS family pyridoxal phosphate-dependent enzyme [Nonlabens sp. Ci31]QJP35363.1 YggS family pyridoxal phosphate-dependent enzyme [Nonlabens sp. Ci31]